MSSETNYDEREVQVAQALAMMDEEMVHDSAIPEPRAQRDECYMTFMKVLYPDKTLAISELEELTTRDGIPLLMLPNGWSRLSEVAWSDSERWKRWELRPQIQHINPNHLTERELGEMIDVIYEEWEDEIMTDEEMKKFHKNCARRQHEMVQKTVAERIGVLQSQLDRQKIAKTEGVAHHIQTFLRAGVPDPFKVQEIQKAITELRGDPFTMDAMKLLVEDMSTKATDAFAINQLTAILGELNVAAEADNNGEGAAESDSSDRTETERCSSDQLYAGLS
jgi:hypothetical protein